MWRVARMQSFTIIWACVHVCTLAVHTVLFILLPAGVFPCTRACIPSTAVVVVQCSSLLTSIVHFHMIVRACATAAGGAFAARVRADQHCAMDSTQTIVQQVWGRHVPPHGGIDLEQQWRRVVVRVIDHDRAQVGRWTASSFWQSCLRLGIDIRNDLSPCTLRRDTHPCTGREFFPAIEIMHMCTQDFWASQARENPSTLAVAVAHMRVLHDIREAHHPLGGWGLVLERDTVPSENAFYLFQCTLRDLALGAEAADGVRYVSLCVSTDRVDHLNLILAAAGSVRTGASTRHRLIPFPWKKNPSGSFQLEHLGQGGRAYLIHTDLIEHLLSKKLWLWWDVFMNGEIPRFSMSRFGRESEMNTARFCFPPAFSHPVNVTEVTRGSSRLEAHVVSPAEKISPYVTLSLTKEWGLANRLCTLAALYTLASLAGWGVHLYWVKTMACDAFLSDVVPTPPTFGSLPGLAFLHVHYHWTHFQAMQSRDQPQNQANTAFQATPSMFHEQLLRSLRSVQPPCPPELLRRVEEADFSAGWRALHFHESIQASAMAYLRRWPSDATHTAVHVRRGDLKRRDLHQASERGSRVQASDVQHHYDDADLEVEDH